MSHLINDEDFAVLEAVKAELAGRGTPETEALLRSKMVPPSAQSRYDTEEPVEVTPAQTAAPVAVEEPVTAEPQAEQVSTSEPAAEPAPSEEPSAGSQA